MIIWIDKYINDYKSLLEITHNVKNDKILYLDRFPKDLTLIPSRVSLIISNYSNIEDWSDKYLNENINDMFSEFDSFYHRIRKVFPNTLYIIFTANIYKTDFMKNLPKNTKCISKNGDGVHQIFKMILGEINKPQKNIHN